MVKRMMVVIGVAASQMGLCGAFGAGEKRPSVVPDEAKWEMLKEGVPVLLMDEAKVGKGKKKRILAGIVIEASAKEVWDVVNDKEAATVYVENLKRAVILKRGVEKGVAYMLVEQDMKMGLLPGTFTYVMRHEMKPYQRIDFKRVSGDLKEIEGYWAFLPVEGGKKTLLVYQLHLEPGMFIPAAVVRGTLKKSLPEALMGVRNQVAAIAARKTPAVKP